MTRTMYDAAYPPPDPHLDVCAFYIGGDTPHVWSDTEIAGQSARWRLPIFTRSNPTDATQAHSDAAAAITWLRGRGVPAGSALALDYETAKDSVYLAAFDKAVVAAGWRVLVYGSLDTVVQNPQPSAGYWTASWTGAAHLDAGAAATQWASDTMLGKPYDLSEVADSLVLWDTAPPVPISDPPGEDDMEAVQPLAVKSGGQYAYSIPAAATGIRLTTDNFGATDQAAKPQLRIALWTGVNPGSSPYVVPGDSSTEVVTLESGSTDIGFPDAQHTCGVTITRLDNNGQVVGVSTYQD
jgi:hypothetical protein